MRNDFMIISKVSNIVIQCNVYIRPEYVYAFKINKMNTEKN